jgi:hypothetical protein
MDDIDAGQYLLISLAIIAPVSSSFPDILVVPSYSQHNTSPPLDPC